MANSKEAIHLYESTRVARYDSIDTRLGYTGPDVEAHDNRYRVMTSKTGSACFDDYKVREKIIISRIVLIFLLFLSFLYFDDIKRVERVYGK